MKLVERAFNFRGYKKFTGVVKDKNNTIVYYLNGKYHREDGPAITYVDLRKEWFLHGKLHREDGPAVEAFGVIVNNCQRKFYYYYLNDRCYGDESKFTPQSWIRFVKLELLK